MLHRQQDVVIQLVDDSLQRVSQRDEVEDVRVAIKGAGQLNRRPPVVTMQPLANVSIERDEVGGAEDQVIFRDAYFPDFV